MRESWTLSTRMDTEGLVIEPFDVQGAVTVEVEDDVVAAEQLHSSSVLGGYPDLRPAADGGEALNASHRVGGTPFQSGRSGGV